MSAHNNKVVADSQQPAAHPQFYLLPNCTILVDPDRKDL